MHNIDCEWGVKVCLREWLLWGKYLVDLPSIAAIFEATENDNIIVFDIFALNGGQGVAVAETRGLAFHLRFDPFSSGCLDEVDDEVSTISSSFPLFSSLFLSFSFLSSFAFSFSFPFSFSFLSTFVLQFF